MLALLATGINWDMWPKEWTNITKRSLVFTTDLLSGREFSGYNISDASVHRKAKNKHLL